MEMEVVDVVVVERKERRLARESNVGVKECLK